MAGLISLCADLKTTCLTGLGVGLCRGERPLSLSLPEPGGVIGITFRYIPGDKDAVIQIGSSSSGVQWKLDTRAELC